MSILSSPHLLVHITIVNPSHPILPAIQFIMLLRRGFLGELMEPQELTPPEFLYVVDSDDIIDDDTRQGLTSGLKHIHTGTLFASIMLLPRNNATAQACNVVNRQDDYSFQKDRESSVYSQLS